MERLEDRLVPAVIIDGSNANPALWSISGDGDGNDRAFFGTPFITAMKSNVPTFYMAGNVTVPDGTEIKGSLRLRFSWAGTSHSAERDLACSQRRPGPGGARSATRAGGVGSSGGGGARGAGEQGGLTWVNTR